MNKIDIDITNLLNYMEQERDPGIEVGIEEFRETDLVQRQGRLVTSQCGKVR